MVLGPVVVLWLSLFQPRVHAGIPACGYPDAEIQITFLKPYDSDETYVTTYQSFLKP
jgi:hypothetical protein